MVREILPCFANALDLGSDERIVSELGPFLALPSPPFSFLPILSVLSRPLGCTPSLFYIFFCLFILIWRQGLTKLALELTLQARQYLNSGPSWHSLQSNWDY